MRIASTFGKNIQVTISGGSHEPYMEVVIAGFPKDITADFVDEAALLAFLQRRAPGDSESAEIAAAQGLTTSRRESDRPKLHVAEPLTYHIDNEDARPEDYEALKDTPRPGHADFPARVKYGDAVNMAGGGPFSGRMTAPLCVAGGIALQWLEKQGIAVTATLTDVGGVRETGDGSDGAPTDQSAKDLPAAALLARIEEAAEDKDSVGGKVHCTVTGLDAGLGGPLFDGLESYLSPILFAIPGVKGVAFGEGFEAAAMTGSVHNDAFTVAGGEVRTATNHAGGILGGISTGMPLEMDVAFKPTSSIGKPQQTVDLRTMEETTITIQGRHDPCIALRAVPVVEACVALGLLDAMMGEGKAEAAASDIENADRAQALPRTGTAPAGIREAVSPRCGLLGQHLYYSYSKEIHEALGLYEYDLYPTEPQDLAEFLENTECTGLNVTIPYKKDIMRYCDEVCDLAEDIGAVNVIYKRDGRWIGTNTDYDGFLATLVQGGFKLQDEHVLILGDGGASSMVQYACETHGAASITVATRRPFGAAKAMVRDGVTCCDYSELPEKTTLLINATPIGVTPGLEFCPVDLDLLPNLIGVVDLIYNPLRTRLMLESEKRGIPCINGLSMLVTQAVSTVNFFAGEMSFPTEKTAPFLSKGNESAVPFRELLFARRAEVIQTLVRRTETAMRNVVLVGMPGSGKSSLGKQLARALNRPFVDTDRFIRDRFGRKPARILVEDGEMAFRDIEQDIIRELATRSGIVIATGGGICEREENLRILKQTGFLLFVQKDVDTLATKGRPLSQDNAVLHAMHERREPIYRSYADLSVTNDRPFQKTVIAILRHLR